MYEKLDGHMMKLFCWQGEWHLTGNSSLNVKVKEFGGRSKYDLFCDALRATTGLELVDLESQV